MNDARFNAATFVQLCMSIVAAVRSCLVWFTGLPGEAVAHHRADVQMRYTAAGLMMMFWFAFMLMAWVKTGVHFFGSGGAFAFALVPGIMLAVDRMILGQYRNPDGALQAYALGELNTKRWEYALRAVTALVFSVVTTSVFLITQAAPDIREFQQREQQKANASLRSELSGRIETQAAERLHSVAARTAELEAQAAMLKEEHAQARKTADEADSRANAAQFNSAAEAGGIDGRATGEGPRHRAYALIAGQSRDVAVNARAREIRAREALAKVLAELQQLNTEREKATGTRIAGMANLDMEMQEDARFVRRKQGMFADATALIRLFGDKDVGPGLVATCIAAAALLLVLEMVPLMGLAFFSTTPVDVERIALNRTDAARIVAEHEIALVNSAAGRAVRVRPLRGAGHAPAQAYNPQSNNAQANQSEEPQ